MKQLLLAGVVALLLTTGTAHADLYIPQQYRGLWCEVLDGDHVYRRCQQADSEAYMEVYAERISVGSEEERELCGIGIVWPTKLGHALTVGCPKGKFSLQMELQLDTRGRLHVKEADRQEFAPPPGPSPR